MTDTRTPTPEEIGIRIAGEIQDLRCKGRHETPLLDDMAAGIATAIREARASAREEALAEVLIAIEPWTKASELKLQKRCISGTPRVKSAR